MLCSPCYRRPGLTRALWVQVEEIQDALAESRLMRLVQKQGVLQKPSPREAPRYEEPASPGVWSRMSKHRADPLHHSELERPPSPTSPSWIISKYGRHSPSKVAPSPPSPTRTPCTHALAQTPSGVDLIMLGHHASSPGLLSADKGDSSPSGAVADPPSVPSPPSVSPPRVGLSRAESRLFGDIDVGESRPTIPDLQQAMSPDGQVGLQREKDELVDKIDAAMWRLGETVPPARVELATS